VWATKQSRWRLVLYAFDKFVTTLNTLCLTDSPSQSQFLYEHGITKHGQALPVLGNGSLSGVDLTRFDISTMEKAATALREELGITEQQFVFAFIARKTRDKGALDVLNAFAQVAKDYPRSLLLFVGPDETKGQLAQLMTETPELFQQVLSIGQVDNHELYLSITDVLCLPSYREGFGTVVIDAAALNVPTIGSNIVGLVDSIADKETGILFPAGDIEQLTAAIQSFLANPSQVKTMGLAARQRVERYFSADKLYAELKYLYFQLDLKRQAD
jgi:glycosyltransferase involved in cell wall biosynthesis